MNANWRKYSATLSGSETAAGVRTGSGSDWVLNNANGQGPKPKDPRQKTKDQKPNLDSMKPASWKPWTNASPKPKSASPRSKWDSPAAATPAAFTNYSLSN